MSNLPSQIILLTAKEALAHDKRIVSSASTLRQSLLFMYEGEGWRAIGHSSWNSYLENVSHRAGYTSKTLHKVTRAARLESGAGWNVGTFPEGSIRPISDGLSDRKGFTEQDRIDALELAITWAGGECEVTSKHSHMVVAYLSVSRSGYRRLASRMLAGELPAVDAFKIMGMMENTDDSLVKTILQEVNDVMLATLLYNMSEVNSKIWPELKDTILATGHVPGANGTQYPIDKATHANLVRYLSEPKRLKYADDMAARRSEMMAVCHAARQVILHMFDGNEPNAAKDPYHNLMYIALKEAKLL